MSIPQVLRYFRAHWAALNLLTALSMVGAVMDAGSVVFVVALADAVSKGSKVYERKLGPLPTVSLTPLQLAALTAATLVVSVATLFVSNIVRSRITVAWASEKRTALLTSFLAAPWSVQSRDRSGRLQNTLSMITWSSSLLGNLSGMARGIVGLLILVGSAVVISPLAAGGILLMGVLLSAVLRPLNRVVKRNARAQTELNKEISEDFGELSELAREIRLFGAEGAFEGRLVSSIQELGEGERRISILSGAVSPIYQGLALLLIVVALAVASQVGTADITVLGAVALLVLRSVSYGQQFNNSITSVNQASAALPLIDGLIDELQAVPRAHGDAELDRVAEVCLDAATFAYDEGEAAVDDVSVTLRSGEIVGVVGPSGAGKSTVAQLLLRLLETTGGEVRVNGRPIGEYSDASWARNVALVPQEPYLMHGTVLDNIAFFRPFVGRDEAEAAARAAGLHDTIETLDHGYETPVGRSTRNLSGGQVQRLGIARALAAAPSMIVLDEPTSALDQHSEAIVQATLESLRGKALVVVIAHRLTTLSICDRIIVMNGGRLEAEGTMASVIETSPFFRSAVEQLALASGGTIAGLTGT